MLQLYLLSLHLKYDIQVATGLNIGRLYPGFLTKEASVRHALFYMFLAVFSAVTVGLVISDMYH